MTNDSIDNIPTLRDLFAAVALFALLSTDNDDVSAVFADYAEDAYEAADAMLMVRYQRTHHP